MSYIDGFVIPLKKKNVAAYKKMAEMSTKENQEKYKNMPMHFDMKRFAFGGFKAIVEA
ncbi:MAG: hypothetical protein AAB933_02655 [Patescibacteria group bacterium]